MLNLTISVRAGEPLSDPFVLLFYGVLCYVTLYYGVLLFYVTPSKFRRISTCQPMQLNMKDFDTFETFGNVHL